MAAQHRLVDSVEVTEEKVHIIHLKSVFDASTADEFEQVLRYLMANNYYKFVIDLTKVEFVSSAGWGNFVGELQKIRDKKGDLKLSGMSKEVYDVFLLLELDLFIKACASIDEALSDFSKNIIGVEEKSISQPPSLKQKVGDRFRKKNKKSRLPAKQKQDIPNPPLFPIDTKIGGQLERDVGNLGDSWFEGEGEIELPLDTGIDFDKVPLQSMQSHPQNTLDPKKSISNKESVRPEAALKNFDHPSDNEKPRTGDRSMVEAQNLDDTREIDFQQPESQTDYKNGKLPEKTRENDFGGRLAYLDNSKISPSDLNNDPLLEKIISVIIANPVYGPSAIRQMLIRLSMADESLTRSIIYRKLQDVDLSTRAKRIAFARANSL